MQGSDIRWWIVFGVLVVAALLVVAAGRPFRFVLRMFGWKADIDSRPTKQENAVVMEGIKAGRDVAANGGNVTAKDVGAGRDVLINKNS